MSRSGERSRPCWLPAVAFLVALVLRILGATWRVRVLGDDPFTPGHGPLVGALWHESVFLAAHFFRDRGIVVMVSRSRDGDAIEAVLSRMGFAGSARGSSSRGGASALRQQVDGVAAGRTGAILVDGPRGPARVAKAGVVRLAQGTGAVIVPVILRARPAYRFRSWDRTILPAPFARVVVAYGRHIAVPPAADAAEREAIRVRVEEALAEAGAEAERALRPRHHAA
jgi:hypothetical protein